MRSLRHLPYGTLVAQRDRLLAADNSWRSAGEIEETDAELYRRDMGAEDLARRLRSGIESDDAMLWTTPLLSRQRHRHARHLAVLERGAR